METSPAPEVAPHCLHAEPPPRSSAQQEQKPSGCLGLGGRSLWPACQGSITALCFLQETEEGLAGHLCWEPMALGSLGALTMAKNSKDMRTPGNLVSPEAPAAPARRRPRKQPNPRPGTEREDPGFKGVTLKFQINPDSSLHILPTYSPDCSSPSQGPPASPARAPEPSPAGPEALGPRRCASCRTQRTPLWRDAEDGTPLCNACGIRYKKYGTRCSSCWLVPRKNVQPKRLCIRCGVSLGPHRGPTHEA